MATLRDEFVDLADELKGDFISLFQECIFYSPTSYDPVTEAYGSPVEQTIMCQKMDYSADRIDGQSIQSNDFMLLVIGADFDAVRPKTDGLKVSVDDKLCSVIRAETKDTGISWILQVRA